MTLFGEAHSCVFPWKIKKIERLMPVGTQKSTLLNLFIRHEFFISQIKNAVVITY